MTHEDAGHYSAKHSPERKTDPALVQRVTDSADEQKINCGKAHAIAKDLGVSPEEVGFTIDMQEFKISRCQLGLFGYSPEKRIVKPAESVDEALKKEIEKKVKDKRLTCTEAWEVAETMGISKLAVSCACEAMGLKIKKCQLGAF